MGAPWANGTVERVNRFIKSSMTKMIDTSDAWKGKLGLLQYMINNTYHSVTKSTPSKLMFGFEQRSHADFPFARFVKDLAQIDSDLEKERENVRSAAETATDAIKRNAYNKEYHDTRLKSPTKYRESDYVLVRDTQHKPGESAKFKAKYKEPYQITKSLGNNRYVVQDIPGFNLTARAYDTILSSDRIKPWIKLYPPINPAKN